MDEQTTKVAAGQSVGKPANGEYDEGSYSLTGGPGVHHWQEATITEPGLDARGNVFFAAIEMTRMPMLLSDPNLPDCPVVFANRAFQDLTYYPQEEIIGRNCRFLQGAQTDREKAHEMRAAIAERRPLSIEILNYKRDGTPFWNAVFIAPVYGVDGRLLYFFATQLDITRRRMSEEAFRQAQKMESIGQLTAGLAHDFGNLLHVIQGNLDVLRRRLGSDDLQRYVQRAHDAAERGSKLTRQLLGFARKTRLETKLIDMNDLITGFAGLLESTVNHRKLELQLRRRLPLVQVDPAHLEMALLNVVINARDASPDDSMIRISTTVSTPDEDAGEQPYVVLSIKDEGAGMPDYVRQRATEPFFTTKAAGKGTGLGLAMVQGFVQQSFGRLEIDSRPGEGATIRMLFPAYNEHPLRPPVDGAQVEPPMREDAEPETILLVEDDESILALALEHLTSLGYHMLTARSADEALKQLDLWGERVDLLFTDIQLADGMNGITLAIRVQSRFPEIAILLTTGYNEDLSIMRPAAPATMDVLGKPYRRSELSSRVRSALNRKADAARIPLSPRPDLGSRHEA